ncbi:hypothetical protein LT493_31180 [Streptomyces tricolor]|nr:hypothetical protein [Streptomyces tricolor]
MEAAAGITLDQGGRRSASDPGADRRPGRGERTTADGDQHYDVASALIKSIRPGSDVDAALHYLAHAQSRPGEDPGSSPAA